MGRVVGMLIAALLCAGVFAGPAAAQDSGAPPGALPHWIPNDDWVYEHWLPYDETRLYSVLRTDRGGIWRWLRDDAAHDLEQLARRRGMTADELTDRLMAPRRASLSAARFAQLRARAYRIVTQGHLSQHIHFHSLHQRSIQDAAPSVFGVSPSEFRDLRVAENSPLEIGRMHGRSAVVIRSRAAAALRRAAARAVSGGAMTRLQGRRLLRRQLAQLPRWLGQRRNNGPPRTSAAGTPVLPVADWANHPSISDDGARVAFDQYRSTIPEARALGEIRVVVASLGAGPLASPVALLEASHADGVVRGEPRSGYHSALSADGRSVTYELAEGNMNYAKRYGEMRVGLRDLAAGVSVRVSPEREPDGKASRSAYNPTVSGDGRLVAYEASVGDGSTALWLADRSNLASRTLVGRGSAGAIYEPRLSADGRVLAFSAADAGTDGRTLVFVRDVASGKTALVSRAGPSGASADDDAYQPSVSADGRFVAFTSAASNLAAGERTALGSASATASGSAAARGSSGAASASASARAARAGAATSRVWVRDLVEGTTVAVSGGAPGGGDRFAFDPSISADGRYVAYAGRASGGDASRASVWLVDRVAGTTTLVSRRTGADGGTADGLSDEPAVSADGTRVAFTSTAANLADTKPGGLTGVFVRDLRAATTTLLSTHAERKVPPVPKAARARARARAASAAPALDPSAAQALLCHLDA